MGFGGKAADEAGCHVAILNRESRIVRSVLTFADEDRCARKPRHKILPFVSAGLDSEIGEVGDRLAGCRPEQLLSHFPESEGPITHLDPKRVWHGTIREVLQPRAGYQPE